MVEEKVINFGAGPCQLSEVVIKNAMMGLVNYEKSVLGICELSHFSEEWKDLVFFTTEDLRYFLNVPITHESFFMNGGGTHQFSSICYNLCTPHSKVQVLVSGYWSATAAKEMAKYCNVDIVVQECDLVDSDEYVFTYYCENETVVGFEFKNGLTFDPKNHFIVCDASSIIGSKKMNISKYGVIFSSLSKNLGIAGSTFVIVHRPLLQTKNSHSIPIVFDWKPFLENTGPTPPAFSIYVTHLNVHRMLERGGLEFYHTYSKQKSIIVYEYIDNSLGFYKNHIPKQHRSITNITFSVNDSTETAIEFSRVASTKWFCRYNTS